MLIKLALVVANESEGERKIFQCWLHGHKRALAKFGCFRVLSTLPTINLCERNKKVAQRAHICGTDSVQPSRQARRAQASRLYCAQQGSTLILGFFTGNAAFCLLLLQLPPRH